MTIRTATAPSHRLEDVARRLGALPRDKQQAFVRVLEERGIDVLSLPIVAQPRPERVPLSFAQQRLWLLDQLHPGSSQYNVARVYAIAGALDSRALEHALAALVERHEALRTTFVEAGGEAAQVIGPARGFALGLRDLSALPEPDARRIARELADTEAVLPFDLARGPLFRAQLVRVAPALHWLLVTSHHIAIDEWSEAVIARDILALYDGHRAGRAAAISEPQPLQYADYALWQRRWLTDDVLAGQLAHWRAELGTGEHAQLLPREPAPGAADAATSLHFAIDPALCERLRAFSARAHTTLFTTMLAVFQVVLHRLSGQTEIRVGSPIANRHRREIEGVVGCFANTQVLRAALGPATRFAAHLDAVKRTVAAAQSHQDLPFERLVEALAPERDPASTPLFQVMLSWHRGLADQVASAGALTIAQEPVDDRDAKFDLVLHMTDDGARLGGELQYRAARVSPAIVAAIADQLARFAAAAIEAPDRPIARLAAVAEPARIRAVHDWNATDAAVPLDPVHAWVAAWARTTPDAPAVQSETRRLTYRELDDRAARIAGLLAARGVGPEDRVGLVVPRSHELVVGLVGIVKAGAAYVALDPRTPPERLRELVADAGIAHAVTDARTADRLTALGVDALVLDDDALAAAAAAPPPAAVEVSPDAAAYVIYTSGSTGRSKGVVVSHRAIASYAHGLLARLELPAGATMALVSTPTADLGNTVLFGALAAGGLLHVVSEDRCFDPDRMSEYVRTHGVDVLKITPSHLGGLLQAASPGDVLPRHALILGGEAASAELLAQVRRHGRCRIVNHYGPTETTVGVLTHEAGRAGDPVGGAGGLPLGRPLPNRQAYVLDTGFQVVPPGVYGELHIGGAGVARGYLGRPDATADRFVPDPFRPGGGRLYRTGDRARYHPDGSIEFAGRNDDQIKLRGHRIEPGEVRAALLRVAGAADAHVMLRDGGAAPRLVAYLVRRSAGDAVAAEDPTAVTAALAAWLPEHMIPSDVVWLDRFPVTANGKLDRRALPEPGQRGAPATAEARAPRTEIEQLIAAVWCEVLQIDAVGADDNFFSLGGDSLLAFQVIARLRKAGATVTTPQLFTHQTIAALARVARRTSDVAEPAAASPAEGAVALTPIQHWLLDRPLVRPDHFNQSVLLELAAPIAPSVLEAALARLAAHHDSLRLRFHRDGDAWRQSYAPPGSGAPTLEVIAVRRRDSNSDRHRESEHALADAARRAQGSLHLADGPVMRAVLFDLGGIHPDRLLLVAHHLIVDGVSWRILIEDLAALVAALTAGVEPVLPAATSSYQAWSAALATHARSPALADETAYWHGAVAGDPARLPSSGDERNNTVGSTRTMTIALDEDETAALLSTAPAAYRTRVDDLLLTALALTVCEWTGHDSAVVHLETHGREPLFADIDTSRTVGWFTATHPLRLAPRPGDLAGSIKRIKDQLRAVPHRGIGYGVLRYLTGDPQLVGAIPEITFNYLGQFDQVFDPAGPFRPATGPTGDDCDPGALRDRWLDVIGLVQGRRLQLDWQYSAALHDESTVARLAERYRHHLGALIAHCSEPAHRGLTPSDVPLSGLDQAALDELCAARAGSIDDVLGLAPIQDGILFHCLAAPDQGLYLTQRTIEITSALDVSALRHAWNEVAAAHDALRTSFVVDGLPRPAQIVWREVEVPIDIVDIVGAGDQSPADLPAAERDAALARILDADRARGFDLARPPLMRITVIHTGAARAQLVWTVHHLLLDGWSAWRVLDDAFAAYQATVRGERASVRRSPPIRDHIARLAASGHAGAEAFWRAELAAASPTFLAPQLRALGALRAPTTDAPAARAGGFAREVLALSAAETDRLRSFAHAESVTVNTIVQGALALAIAACTGRDEVVFGITVSGRSAAPAPDDMVGLFINTLPLRVALPANQPVAAWLRELQAQNAAMREHEHAPLVRVQRWTGVSFDTLLVFENYPAGGGSARGLAAADLLGVGELAAHTRTSYPIALEVAPDRALTLQLDVELSSVGRPAARGLLDRIHRALDRIAGAAGRRLAALSLVTDEERRALATWNQTAARLPAAPSVHALVAAQADRAPDAVAVVDRDRKATYRELDARANQLAWRLLDAGVGPESIVAICAPRSLELVVGLLGILKAGAAYLPLDPAYPASRIEHMIGDARPAIILAGAAERDARWATAARVWPLEDLCAGPVRAARPPAPVASAQLAYCIYTSGSTGAPKGVTVSHENLINFLAAMAGRLAVAPQDSFLALTSLSFDIAALELWLPLTRGARIVLAEREEAADADRLLQRLAERSVTVVQATPTTWRTLSRRTGPILPPSCRLLCGGEAMPADLAGRLRERAASVINVYGPTETTVWSTLHVLGTGLDAGPDAAGAAPSIGRALDNTSVHVLDAQLRPVPPGVTGELYIGGLGVARGYLRRPELTAQRFLPDPWSSLPGARMYRTGDLGRHRPDGTLECLGRTDDQIKLRGHRIELGEIEARLLAQPGVAQAAVAARAVGAAEPQLVAYVVADAAATAAAAPAALEAELRRQLAHALPAVMLPQHYCFLAELPRTANGKLDRRALPTPHAGPSTPGPDAAPRDDLERTLAAVWAHLLGSDAAATAIGIHDDFFALGGDSLIALQVVTRGRSLGLAIAPRDLFEHPTIARLAAHLAAARPSPLTTEAAPRGQDVRHRSERVLDDRTAALLHDGALDRHRVPLDAALLAALAGALRGRADLPRIELESALRGIDRTAVDLARLADPIAPRTAGPPAIEPELAVLDLVSRVARMLTRAPADRAAAASPASPATDGAAPGILVRYLGAIDPEGDPAMPASPHPLVVTCALRHGAVVIAVDRDDGVPASDAEALTAALIDELGRAIHELADAAPLAPRPESFAHVELEAGELDDLLGDLS